MMRDRDRPSVCDFLETRFDDQVGRPVERLDMTELLRPGALRIPDLEGESLVVVGEDDTLGAIGKTGDRCGVIRADRQFRGALDSVAVDHDPITGTRLHQETGLPRGEWRPQPRRAGHTLAGFHHVVPPDERDGSALSPDVFRSLLNMLAVRRARINAVSHRTSWSASGNGMQTYA